MDKTGWRAELIRAKNDIPKLLFIARHVSLILKQIRFVTRHAVFVTRSDDAQSIAAIRQIAIELRRSAYAVEAEAKRREASARARAERNAILMRDREQSGAGHA
jgi:hypothetical protein